ncbi:MAG: hypothetical protein AAFW95_14730 [Cyanobacteria bacterium J06638_6]
MTGFIRGLLGGKKSKNPGEADRSVSNQPTIERAGGAFYLNPDDAKSYGDIDYMRSSKTVRRTYAKKAGESGEKESIRQVSALEARRLQENGLPQQKTPQSETSSPSTAKSEPRFERRKVDTNLDMFRQMAKDIKK